MTTTLKITSIGNSAGVILPKELLEKLRVSKGDTLFVTETPNGLELSAHDEEVERQMEIAEKLMRENRNLLRKLAQ
jgi:putative addiction module antidote